MWPSSVAASSSALRHAGHGVDLPVKVGVVARVVMALAEQGVAAVVMEERWVRQDKGIATAMMIRDVSTGVLWLATAAGLKVTFVPINKWHMQILGNGGLKSEAAKRESVLYVERVYSFKAKTNDEADSICLATWGASVAGLEIARRANGGRR